MQIILPWTKGVSAYQSEFEALQLERPHRCLGCGCTKFHKWGKYERYVIEERGDSRVSVRRIRCAKCGKTYSYLPTFCVSHMSYGADFVMKILTALILKLRLSLEERRRRAYTFLRRFRESENLWLVFLRAQGFGEFPADKKERMVKIFTALLECYSKANLLSSFFGETGRHFMSAK